jgi:hypothetical protein
MTMRHLRVTVQTNRRPMAIALGLVLMLGLTGCARSSPVSVSVRPDQIQTLHQDDVTYTWAYGSCPSNPPPLVPSASGDSALVGTESWPSGGQAGYECATTFRFSMAGVRFPVRGLAWGATTHAQLAFGLEELGEPLTSPPTCRIEVTVAEHAWAQEDPRTPARDPYAVLFPGNLGAIGAGSAHRVTYDRRTQTVTVDATAAVGDWIAQRQPNQGFLFKSFTDCGLTRLTSIVLLLSQG